MITRRFTRVDLTNATEDYLLKVGEEAYISFNNVSSIPLRIATTNDTFYELHLLNSNPGTNSNILYGGVFLFPNNTVYDNIRVSVIYRSSAGHATIYYLEGPGFPIGASFFVAIAWLINRKQYKNVRTVSNLYGYSLYFPLYWEASTDWGDTTTEWTSLGTIVYPAPASGEIIVRRLM